MSSKVPGSVNRRLADLVRTQTGNLTRFFYRRAPDRSEVPDLVQEVFLKLARTELPETLNTPHHYVAAVARSVLVDHYRRRRVRHVEDQDEIDGDVPDTGLPIERVLDSKALAERMHMALLGLPERTRDVFALRTLGDMKMAAVAETLEISLSTVEKHHARALAHLAAELVDFR